MRTNVLFPLAEAQKRRGGGGGGGGGGGRNVFSHIVWSNIERCRLYVHIFVVAYGGPPYVKKN